MMSTLHDKHLYKENQTNIALLLKLYGEEWMKKRDEALEAMRPKPKQQQLKLWT